MRVGGGKGENRADVCVRSTSVMAAPSTAARIAAQVGPPVARGTRLQTWWPGSRRSRAMDQIIRLFVTMITIPQAKIEMQTKIRNSFWTTPPSTSLTMNATGALLALAALTELVA